MQNELYPREVEQMAATVIDDNKSTQQTEKQRASNFELLRCLTMLWITIYHLNHHGFLVYSTDINFDFNNIIIKSISSLSGFSNLVFLMISGYFLIDAKFSWKKVFKLWFQCFFYSAIIGICLYVTKANCVLTEIDQSNCDFIAMNKRDFIKCFFPILSNNNWFTTYYILFYILSPFVVPLIKNISQRQHFTLIVITVIAGPLLSIITSTYVFSNLYYFVVVFLIASYIRLYSPKITNNLSLCLTIAISILIVYLAAILTSYKWLNGKGINRILGMTKLPMLLFAVSVFCIFKNLKVKYNPFINKIASCTLTVYLLHDNSFRQFIWQKIFHISDYRFSKFYLPYSLVVVLIIFTSSILIELIRKRIIEKPVLKLYDRITAKINKQ